MKKRWRNEINEKRETAFFKLLIEIIPILGFIWFFVSLEIIGRVALIDLINCRKNWGSFIQNNEIRWVFVCLCMYIYMYMYVYDLWGREREKESLFGRQRWWLLVLMFHDDLRLELLSMVGNERFFVNAWSSVIGI